MLSDIDEKNPTAEFAMFSVYYCRCGGRRFCKINKKLLKNLEDSK